MDCRKQCDCHNRDWTKKLKDRERCVPEIGGLMGVTALWEKIRPAILAGMEDRGGWFAAWMARLKAGVAEIAAVRSSQQFGRKEEKE